MALKGLDWHREEINACLTVAQREHGLLEIDVRPFEPEDFSEAGTRENQQPDGHHHVSISPFALRVRQHFTQAG